MYAEYNNVPIPRVQGSTRNVHGVRDISLYSEYKLSIIMTWSQLNSRTHLCTCSVVNTCLGDNFSGWMVVVALSVLKIATCARE